MAKDDSKKGKAPRGGADPGKPASETEAKTVMLTVPPHLLAQGAAEEAAERKREETTRVVSHDAPTVVMREPPGHFEDEPYGGGGDSPTMMLVNPEAAMAAARAALESDAGTREAQQFHGGEADEDLTPPSMWINPHRRHDTPHAQPKAAEAENWVDVSDELPAAAPASGGGDAPTSVLMNPLEMVARWREEQERKASGGQAAVSGSRPATPAASGEPEGATVLLQAPPSTTLTGEEGATVMLDRSGSSEAVGEQATVMLDHGRKPEDESGVDEAFATVMLTAPPAPAGAPDPGATVMLDKSGGAADPGATVMLDKSGEAADAGATVMLDKESAPSPGGGGGGKKKKKKGHGGQAAAGQGGQGQGGAVRMGAAASAAPEGESMFADPYHKVEVGEDVELDITADPRVPDVGETVAGRYEIKRLLGKGGFAAVFEAVDKSVGGSVAIKVLQAEKSQDAEFAKRFRQEVLVARALQHPNTIKITDTGRTDRGCLYMVMEYVKGTPLDEYLKKHGALTPARSVHIVEQILKALAEAHERGIIHRDMKPPNVMLTSLGGGEEDFVKVLDFGIAKALEADLTQVQTKTGIIFCTPKYAPPEILTGRKISPAADIYAVGLILAECMIGQPVLASPSDAEAIAYQLSPERLPVPPEIENTAVGKIIKKAIEKKVEERYKDAAEMLAAMRKVEQQHLPTVPLQIKTQNPTATGAIQFESTLQMMSGAGGAATVRVGEATRAAAVQKRSSPVFPVLFGIVLLAALVIAYIFLTRKPVDTGENVVTATGDAGEVVVSTPDAGGQTAMAEGEQPGGPTAREILAARLAASDWQAGSWIEVEEERPVRTQRPPREPQTPTVGEGVAEGTGPGLAAGTGQMAALEPIDGPQILLIDDPSMAAQGTGEGTGGPLAVAAVTEPAVDPKVEAERLAALYESAQSNADALDLLEAAMTVGAVTEEERLFVEQEILLRTENIVAVMIELDRCDAAERRLDRAMARVASPSIDQLTSETLMREEIQACRDRMIAERPTFDPTHYLGAVADGDRYYEEAMATPESDAEARRALLYQSVHSRQQAIGMLETALNTGVVPEQHREAAGRDLAHLNEQVMATLMDLELQVAVDVQIEETLENQALLPQDVAQDLTMLQDVIVEEVEEEKEQEIQAIQAETQAAAQPTPIEGTGVVAQVGTGEGTGVLASAGTGEGTGAVALAAGAGEGTGAVAAAGTGWNWRAAYAAQATTAAELFEEAQDLNLVIEQQIAEAQTPPEPIVEEPTVTSCTPENRAAVCEPGMVCLSGVCSPPQCTPEDQATACAAGQVCLEGICSAPPLNRVTLRVTSDPSGARVLMGRETLGRTPYEGVIESADDAVTISVRKTDYEDERFEVQMVDGGEVARTVELELSNPFGRTAPLAEQLRRRRGSD